ncbi:transcriptional regulator [Bacterioplanes sanyensis]|uniref:LuxR C-terminal-related transcriptional regulator n=1 Tax=Bacterioplanes sanyensis TaxID=1249553 RepID=UPI001985A9C2|nr:LuxR C-terminal-related transcriptional regulator [Bacterioplanes sanyensis]GGY48505.1 transcriptional regulator [Bacterioplanes sanyensis]
MELTPSSPLPWAERLEQKSLAARIAVKARIPDCCDPWLARLDGIAWPTPKARIVWLLAPAGFGKTQLMAEQARRHCAERPVVWMSLDSNDASPASFLRHFLELAEAQLPGIATDALAHWQATQQRGDVDIGGVLLLWIQEASSFEQPLLLCLDDTHYLQDAWQVLNLIIEQLPDNIQLWLSSRWLPDGHGRLQVLDHVAWLRQSELAFSESQARQWLQHSQMPLSEHGLAELHQQLQGWPAALRIWLNQSLRAQQPLPVAEVLPAIADYVHDAVLQQLPPELATFLCQAAVLRSFDEPLLHHCLATSDYHQHLQQARQQQLFIRPQPSHPGWFAVAAPVVDVLAERLPLAERRALHQRAFDWLSQHGESVAALRHAQAAGLTHSVAHWVEQEAEAILANLDIAGLLAWFEQAGSELVMASPRSMQMAAWAWLLTQQQAHAAPLLQKLQYSELPAAELYALQGYSARLQGQLPRAQQLCEQALQQLPAQRYALRILMSSTLAHLALSRNDPDGARLWNRYAQDVARHHRATAMEALMQYDYARIELNRGNISRASQIIEQALELLQEGRQPAAPLPHGRLLLYRAFLLWLHGRPQDEARVVELLQQGMANSVRAHDIAVCYGFAVQAMRATAVGDSDRALDWLDQAERLMQRWRVAQSGYDWLLLVKANVWISQHKLQRAQGCIDEICRGRACHELPSPEVFPMLPGLAAVTQARLYLVAQDYDACLHQAEDWLQHSRGNLMNQVMQLVRAGALQSRQHPDSHLIQSRIQQLLERQGIQMDLSVWLPAGNAGVASPSAAPEAVARLSARELDVLRKMAQGFSNQEIADQLFISLHTVKTHARKINVKLGARSRTQAIHRAKEMLLL